MDNKNEIYTKHFSMNEAEDSIIVVYKVLKSKQMEGKFTVERIQDNLEFIGNQKKRTFYIDNPLPDGNPLIILILKEKKVIINSVFLENDRITINKKNFMLDTQVLCYQEDMEYKKFIYTPTLRYQIAIIDIATGDEVKPYLYMDEINNVVMGKYRLLANKKYFVFQVKDENKNI